MILDSFKLHSLVLQFTYPDAYIVWDRAGDIARHMQDVWPGLALEDSKPNEQNLRSDVVTVSTGVRMSTITNVAGKGLDQLTIDRMVATVDIWRQQLELSTFNRVSCRAKYVRDFSDKAAAIAEVLSWNLFRIPNDRVFNHHQTESNTSVEGTWKFEDKASFTFLRVGAEEITIEIKAHPDFPETQMKKTAARAYIDFDRGSLGEIDAKSFWLAEWLKGYLHVLHRDLPKVIPSKA